MNKASELTASAKKEITADWEKSFPLLGVYKPMWLLKRHGPLLMGILLDRTRSNDMYIPKFHVHNLLAPSPSILLSLVYSAPDLRQPKLPRQIKVLQHKQDYSAAVDFFKHAAPDLSDSELTWPRLVKLHIEFIRQRRDYAVAKYCSHIFRDVVLLARWCGHEDYARLCEAEALKLMKTWSPAVDISAWSDSLHRLLDPATMREKLDGEIAKHKLERVPAYKLDAGGEAESVTAAYAAVWN